MAVKNVFLDQYMDKMTIFGPPNDNIANTCLSDYSLDNHVLVAVFSFSSLPFLSGRHSFQRFSESFAAEALFHGSK